MTKKAINQPWGFWTFSLASAIALVKLLLQDAPGHYRVFTGAGHALMQGLNPYQSTFGTGIGYYFYSPSCGLTLFGPFSVLPEKIGLALYMLLSWFVFVHGTKEFLKSFTKDAVPEQSLNRNWNWFWFVISSQIWGGILASKVEILMTGILLLCAAWIMQNRRGILSAVFLSMILNWKFQPLPSVGLMILAWLFIRREFRWPLHLVLGLAGWYALPYLLLPHSHAMLSEAHRTWGVTLHAFVQKAWLDFENIFAFLNHACGVPLTYRASQWISLAGGLTFAGILLQWILTRRNLFPKNALLNQAILLALALGSAYTIAFSPLAQNNALIVYTPLLIAAFFAFENTQQTLQNIWKGLLIAIWGIMTLPYSEIFPESIRDRLRYLSLKPAACMILALAVCTFYFKQLENTE